MKRTVSEEMANENLREMCERHGYGFVMSEVARMWHAKDPIGAKTTGTAVGLLTDSEAVEDWRRREMRRYGLKEKARTRAKGKT